MEAVGRRDYETDRGRMPMRRWVYSVLALAAAAGVCAPPADAQQDRKKKKIVLPPNSFYSLGSKTLEGQPIGLTDFAGQVALVVNLASR